MMIYREDYYDTTGFPENPGVTNVYIRKNRNGPTGQVDLKFEKQHQKFYEIERARGNDFDGE